MDSSCHNYILAPYLCMVHSINSHLQFVLRYTKYLFEQHCINHYLKTYLSKYGNCMSLSKRVHSDLIKLFLYSLLLLCLPLYFPLPLVFDTNKRQVLIDTIRNKHCQQCVANKHTFFCLFVLFFERKERFFIVIVLLMLPQNGAT